MTKNLTARNLNVILNFALIPVYQPKMKIKKLTGIRVYLSDILVASCTVAGGASREWAEKQFKKPGHPGFLLCEPGYQMARSFGLV